MMRWSTRFRARRLLTGIALLVTSVAVPHAAAHDDARTTPTCHVINSIKDLPQRHATSVTTIEQGYRCLLAHYVSGKKLDDRLLLHGALDALQPVYRQEDTSSINTSLTGLTGDRDHDWLVFRAAYESIAAQIVQIDQLQQTLAALALDGMARALHDDHTAFLTNDEVKPELEQLFGGRSPSLGLVTSPISAKTPLFITDVFAGEPAAQQGLLPGDVIAAIDGQPPFTQGHGTAGLAALLLPSIGTAVTLTIHRPATNATVTVSLQPRLLIDPAVGARILTGNIGYVKLYAFTTHAASQVFTALRGLGLGSGMHGMVLDLRGNGGGDKDEALRIISAFLHHTIVGYEVDGGGHTLPQRTFDRIPLLHQPLALLIDGDSASSSEVVAGAVRDFHLGRIIGTRSAGALAGAEFYGLNDASGLEITEVHVLGPQKEQIDRRGIAPDIQAPATAAELSAGRDPAIERALQYLRQLPGTHGLH